MNAKLVIEFEMLSANERAVDIGLEIMRDTLYFIDKMLRENLQHTIEKNITGTYRGNF